MDNLCHTLVGAALGEAGLKTRTRFGNPALMIAANLPDLDVLVFVTGTPAVSFRRGWTHGVLAQAMLPVAFAAVLLLLDRWRPRRDPGAGPPARAGALLLIGYLGVLSHVLLDYLNNYGVRLLMPFSERWFYGDTLFIVDPWLWGILGAGVYFARRRAQPGHARRALAASAVYVLAMALSAGLSRQIVRDAWTEANGRPPNGMMVGPLPVTPWSRAVIVDAGDHYETGTFSWLSPHARLALQHLANRADDPAVRVARNSALRAVLRWSRFPYFEVRPLPEGLEVTFTDLRFGARVGRTTVLVPR